jgi:hypothetical protein
MVGLRSDPQRGTLYRCACGAEVWSALGGAEKHAQRCRRASSPPTCASCGGLLVRSLRPGRALECVRCRLS